MSYPQQRLKTGSRPPGTASRLATAMRPENTMRGEGLALQTQVQVADRPMTQHGLGGMNTASGQRTQRIVQDKTYFLGVVRNKVNDLTMEIARLNKETENMNEENNNFLSYEKRAETLASEIKRQQGELADYNTLVDKMNTDEDISDMQADCVELRDSNAREQAAIEELFQHKKEKEELIHQLEVELDQDKRMADNMVNDMPEQQKSEYFRLKDLNEHLIAQLEKGQQELDTMNTRKQHLEEELSMSAVKQEAVRLYEQLHELEAKRQQLVDEESQQTSPQVERERLLNQVKQENQEIAAMERQMNDVRERVNTVQEEIHQLDMDIEENKGERNQKFKELKKREEMMNEFMETFEQNKAQELGRLGQLEESVVQTMDLMGRNMSRFSHLPSPAELEAMKNDLEFKASEMKKSESTAVGLAAESDKLQADLAKVEQLEAKIKDEMRQLKGKIDQMETELVMYEDLDKLRREAEEKKERLQEEKVTLGRRKDAFKKYVENLSSLYRGRKAELEKNETYSHLTNLERKWQHHEQNNFVMKEFIATKQMECDYQPNIARVGKRVSEINRMLQDQMGGKSNY